MAFDPTAQSYIATGQAALNTGDWRGARAAYEASIRELDTPEARDGLGIALWWLNEIDKAHEERTAAYLGYKQRGDLRRAALIATWLGREQVFLRGNSSAMIGWFARADSLLDRAGPGVEDGWCNLFRASMVGTPEMLNLACTRARAIARQYSDPDLEGLALAFNGMALVSLGHVDDGMRQLDESMAMVTAGEIGSFMAISEVFCVLLSACALVGDLARTEQWCAVATEFARRYHCFFLSAYCRTTYGGLLTTTGHWQAAETELTEAIRAFESGHRALRIHAALKLADLRISQGKLEEAGALLAGYEDYGAAAVPRARLYLAQGEPLLARAVLDQALQSHPSPILEHTPHLSLLVEVLLALGDLDGARRAADSMMALARDTHSDLLIAQAELARGYVRQKGGEAAAVDSYQAVLSRLPDNEQSLLAARARLAMARALKSSDWAGAVTWARAALASFERIGALHEADESAALLRELGASGRVASRSSSPLTRREAEVLALVARGLTNREIAERLVISPKTVEHHVGRIFDKLELRSRTEAAAYVAGRHL